jgi:hypothetical protein
VIVQSLAQGQGFAAVDGMPLFPLPSGDDLSQGEAGAV